MFDEVAATLECVRATYAWEDKYPFEGAHNEQWAAEFDRWLTQRDALMWERGWLTVSVDHREGVGDINPVSGLPIATTPGE